MWMERVERVVVKEKVYQIFNRIYLICTPVSLIMCSPSIPVCKYFYHVKREPVDCLLGTR